MSWKTWWVWFRLVYGRGNGPDSLWRCSAACWCSCQMTLGSFHLILFHLNLASGIPLTAHNSSIVQWEKCIFTLSLYFAADTSIFLILERELWIQILYILCYSVMKIWIIKPIESAKTDVFIITYMLKWASVLQTSEWKCFESPHFYFSVGC